MTFWVVNPPDHQLPWTESEHITVTSHAALKHLKSPETWLYVQETVLTSDNKKHQGFPFLGLYERNPLVTGGFSSKRASKAEIVFRSWHYHGYWKVPHGISLLWFVPQAVQNEIDGSSLTGYFWVKIGNWTRMSGSRLQYYLQTFGPCFKMKCTGNPTMQIRWS